jgi:predicted YcjX-like family ATPase
VKTRALKVGHARSLWGIDVTYPANKPHAIGESSAVDRESKHAALRHILDAWEEAVYEGIDPDCIATAAIFAALSDMIATYGEEPVAKMTEGLADRIRQGEFTVIRTRQ